MALSAGTRLGAYEILSTLGAGGMGEVYRARDTKLGRGVAVKVLPEAFLSDAERVARFEREEKVLASLNHRHIAALYGMEESDPSTGSGQGGRRVLVMELVEGETLVERIAARASRAPAAAATSESASRGAAASGGGAPRALEIEEALKIAQQIAEALEAAHEKGIVHRDLKPANVKVTPDDNVKVLDFGLAKAMETESADVNLSRSPTLSIMATHAGLILGTAAYMSPEQAKGLPADPRSDVFSFASVLYEMLTAGSRFRGTPPPTCSRRCSCASRT